MAEQTIPLKLISNPQESAVKKSLADSAHTLTIDGGGNDGNIGNMEARVAKLESDVEHIKADIRELRADVKNLPKWLIGTAIGIVAIIFAVSIPLILHESNRNWEVAQKALERGNEANIKAEALRLATEWRQKTPTQK